MKKQYKVPQPILLYKQNNNNNNNNNNNAKKLSKLTEDYNKIL